MNSSAAAASNYSSSQYRVHIKTVQSNPFKILVEALKEILTDTNLDIDSTGIKIITMDPSQTVLVHLKLDASNFEIFECKERIVIGVSMLNLFKLIKTMTNNDTLELNIEEDETNKLNIIIENGEKNSITKFKLNLIDLDEHNISVPPAVFDSIITMPSGDFQKICRDMNNLSDTIEIRNIGSQLIFACRGDFAEQETVIGEINGNGNNNGMNFNKTSDTQIIQGYYNLRHLVLFTKCTNLCNSIEMYMKNNFPLVIKFNVGSLGGLTLALAPKVNDN
jgi:proliferating cell nuclear antigen